MKLIKNFIQHYKNASLCIEQIKNKEWELSSPNIFDGEIYTAHRNGQYLWLANGGFFTDIEVILGKGKNYFGYFWRHYVWWFGVKKYLLKKPEVPILE